MYEVEDGKERQDGSQFFRNAYGSQCHYGGDDPRATASNFEEFFEIVDIEIRGE